jgi:ABC-type transport system involved in cytochrome c biogenesis permease subunit
MKQLLLNLASLRLAVILLIFSLIALAMATIVESIHGTGAAGRYIYYALWFQVLMGLLIANTLASIAIRYPWGRQRVGFLMTHSALVVILVGAAVTYFLKTEGELVLWEGETKSEFSRLTGTYQDPRPVPSPLPFAVHLDDFQIDTYPGTNRPAMYRSKVEVTDNVSGTAFTFDIEMNKELSYRGWSLFQSSYQRAEGRDMTVLSVSRDPGQPIVFVGYVLLVVGMCVVLATRISQFRSSSLPAPLRELSGGGAGARRGAALGLMLLAVVAAGAQPAQADSWLAGLPVQYDGRTMPLDTLARENVWKITGRTTWQGQDPAATVLAWTTDPQTAANTPLVEVGSDELLAAAGLPAGTEYASFQQLVSNRNVMSLFEQARQEQAQDRPLSSVLEDAQDLEARLVRLQGFLQGGQIRPIPPQGDPTGPWSPPADPRSFDSFTSLLEGPRLAGWPSVEEIERELRYNAYHPTRFAWILLSVALLASLLAWNTERRWLDAIALIALIGGVLAMTWGIWVRWEIAGRIPASNMYESLLFLGWGAGVFALIAFLLLRNRIVVVNAAAGSALTMLLTDWLPIDGFIHPMPPVLSGTPWLAIHVPIIMTGYAVLALGVVFAHMQIGFSVFAPGRRELIVKMSELLYWYTHVGSILLLTGILTGSIWAAESWGRYWGWDPKEVWSLVAFLAYVAILHARWERMIGMFGAAAWSILAFQTVLMTYLGVNFVLSAGLHSYGFGSSSVVNWMLVVALAETAFILFGWWVERRRSLGVAASA